MAKQNKSEAIRHVLAAKPAASVKEIRAALAAKRMRVSAVLIHQVRGKANGIAPTFDNLLAAKGFVAKLGSIEAAKSALESYAKLI